MELRKCPKCGKIDTENYGFCIKCGTEFTEDHPAQRIIIQDQLVKRMENAQNPNLNNNRNTSQKSYTILIILGYIFAILGGLIGLIIALYLVTRKNKTAKKHGLIQLSILAFYVIIIATALLTGVIDMNTLINLTTNSTLFNHTPMFK